jgi:two-component system NtrC family response regulator
MKNVLIIDDEIEMLNSLEKILSYRNDFNMTLINDPGEAKYLVENKKFDLIISDLKMKKVSGLDIIKSAMNSFPDSLIIIISGYGSIEASVEAMRYGAFDFLEKPFSSQKLFDCINRAFKTRSELKKDVISESSLEKSFEGIIYKSDAFNNVLKLVKKVAPTAMNILITGESGTGKELIARAIHKLSKNNEDPFVPVNCGALPEGLFESELFGHERGAFTGAVKTKPGLLEFANNGTFFLDEISELGQTLQAKLLRMLEDKKIRRVGGQSEIDIDVRIISASNKNLHKAVEDNTFREDLFYRLATIEIDIPPLRDRVDDIMPLANHSIAEICKKEDEPLKRFSPEAEMILKSYSWPGNVRELQNIIGRMYYLCSGPLIRVEDLPIPISDKSDKISNKFLTLGYKIAKDRVLENFEVEYLTYHLKLNKGNISRTAELCGMDRRTIHRLIKEYNIIYKGED